MFLLLARLWQMLRAKLPFCGGAHFLAGAPSLPPPLSPEQEKALLARMSAEDAAARNNDFFHGFFSLCKKISYTDSLPQAC